VKNILTKIENVKIDFNQIKTISFKPSKFYRALGGFTLGAFIGGLAGYFLYKDDDNNNNFFEILGGSYRIFHAIRGAFIVGAGGSIIGLATNPEYHLNIGHNEWEIK